MTLRPTPSPSDRSARSRRRLVTGATAGLACWSLLTATSGCRCANSPTERERASASASASVVLPPAPRASASIQPYLHRIVPRVGPTFAVLPGEGIGPIYFGATPATVRRQMTRACDVETAEVCRYFPEAVEFFFRDGVVAEIRIHRIDRPAGKDAQGVERVYGNFSGAIPADPDAGRPDITTFGMHAEGAQEGLGAPLRTETVDGLGPNRTVAIHYYDGLVVEYDRVPEAKVPVIGGLRVVPRAKQR